MSRGASVSQGGGGQRPPPTPCALAKGLSCGSSHTRSLSLRSHCPGARSGLGEVEGSLPLPWGSQVLCLRARPPSPPLRLASPLTAERKKLGDRCQGNVPTVVPSINHGAPGYRALFKTHRWFEVSAGTPSLPVNLLL